MKLECDTMAAWFGFVLRCDCGYAVKPEWNLCPKCGKPLEKPKFGKCQGSVVYVRPSEIARVITKAMFASAKESEVK